MTPSAISSNVGIHRANDPAVGAPDLAPASAGLGYNGTEAKIMAGQQALHVVMVHFLTSTAI